MRAGSTINNTDVTLNAFTNPAGEIGKISGLSGYKVVNIGTPPNKGTGAGGAAVGTAAKWRPVGPIGNGLGGPP